MEAGECRQNKFWSDFGRSFDCWIYIKKALYIIICVQLRNILIVFFK